MYGTPSLSYGASAIIWDGTVHLPHDTDECIPP